LFCDAPFVDQSQPYVILRSKRVAWSLGQILYIVALSALYFLFLFLISNLFIFSHVDFSLTGWGKVLGTLANTSAAQEMGLLSFIDSRTLYYFTPLQAVWFTFLLSWLVGVFLGLTIYLLNSATQTRIIGVLIATSFLILDSVITGIPQATWLSPVSWSTLNHVGIGAGSQYPPIGYIYGGFAVLIITLLVLSVAVNRRQDINVVQPV
jgi:hypothetical protein